MSKHTTILYPPGGGEPIEARNQSVERLTDIGWTVEPVEPVITETETSEGKENGDS